MGHAVTGELNIPGYTAIRKIGEGGMSSVWLARYDMTGKLFAVKQLNRNLLGDQEEVTAFRSEESLMEEIHHPGIVQAYCMNRSGGNLYLIMEYVDGYTFADLLKRKQHIKEADCLLICESVASALDYAWNDHGIVHCDLKPENIMINTDGIVKLTDLGISNRFKETSDGTQAVPDHVTGTPAYISPEQVYGDVILDCRSDIYSLAATLYHLATGRVLFPNLSTEDSMRAHCSLETQAPDPRAYRPELTEGFAQMLEAMLVKDRDYRVASWANVYQMCQDIESGLSFKPRPGEAISSVKLCSQSSVIAPSRKLPTDLSHIQR